MVDFGKLRGKGPLPKELDPLVIFSHLEKETGKDYLFPPQESILREWYQSNRNKKDLIVKLHTGQGKTLIGLLMLQSSINEGFGPAVYLCPNRYLVEQIIEDARSFGIKTVSSSPSGTPLEFRNSEAIFVTTCQKMFNGKSVFGVLNSDREPIEVGTVAIDDAHKCIDIIRDSFSVRVDRSLDDSANPLYEDLWNLFHDSLKRQAPGTHSDIRSGAYSFMAVPYWTWIDKQREVLEVLGKYKEDQLFFSWDLIKNHLAHSLCIFSGTRLQITPRLVPIDLIPSFSKAKRRIFLSATLTEDAFLIKDLGIDSSSVVNPLSSSKIKYSGERMILMPTLVDPKLTREDIIRWISQFTVKRGDFGVVALVPSFKHAIYWEKFGAIKTDVDTMYDAISTLKDKARKKTAKDIMVLVNEYDGVDLPNTTCRILCLDSLPSYSSLYDGYIQRARPNSTVIRRQLAQRIEQGFGRAIRGSSDWCIVLVMGSALTDFLSEQAKRVFLSSEARTQIRIAEEVRDLLKAEGGGWNVIEKLVNQCLSRDEEWRGYYREKMEDVEIEKPNKEYVDCAIQERRAELLNIQGNHQGAADIIQELTNTTNPEDRGWYFQLMATYLYYFDKAKSTDKQIKAHSENQQLFRPESGTTYSKLEETGTSREALILEWIRKHDSHSTLIVELASNLDKLAFGNEFGLFEEGVDELGKALGFATQRPEKQIADGPDNLWKITEKEYWLISCKNMVSINRTTVSEKETGQLNNDIAWFKKTYTGSSLTPVLIHPANILEKGAHLSQASWILRQDSLEKLRENIRLFYSSFQGASFDSITPALIRQKLKAAKLDYDSLKKEYLERVNEQ